MKCTCCGYKFRWRETYGRNFLKEYRCPQCHADMRLRWYAYIVIGTFSLLIGKFIDSFTDSLLGNVIALTVLFSILYTFRNVIVELFDFLHLYKWVKDE